MSQMIPCPDCGHTVSRQALACPSCGRQMRSTPINKIGSFLIWAFGIIVLVPIVFIAVLFVAGRMLGKF